MSIKVSLMDDADLMSGGLGKLSLIVCHAELDSESVLSACSSPSSLEVLDCGGASCSPGLSLFCSLIFSSAAPADVGAVCFWLPDSILGAQEDHAEDASRRTGRDRGNGEGAVQR
jgi:hypothetical protein